MSFSQIRRHRLQQNIFSMLALIFAIKSIVLFFKFIYLISIFFLKIPETLKQIERKKKYTLEILGSHENFKYLFYQLININIKKSCFFQ